MEDIRQDMRICGWVDDDIISDKMEWRQKIRVVDRTCEEVKVKIKKKKRKTYIMHKWYQRKISDNNVWEKNAFKTNASFRK